MTALAAMPGPNGLSTLGTLWLSALAVTVAPSPATGQVVGLLSVPELFGEGPCHRYDPQDVPAFLTPDSAQIVGVLRVTSPWIHHEGGGCEGRELQWFPGDGGEPEPMEGLDFPALEYGYEELGLVVLEARPPWYRVDVGEETPWIRASEASELHRLEDLLLDGLTYLTDDWAPVVVRETRWDGGVLHLDVAVLSHSPCTSVAHPTVVERRWMPAHDADGFPTVWFSSRGC